MAKKPKTVKEADSGPVLPPPTTPPPVPPK